MLGTTRFERWAECGECDNDSVAVAHCKGSCAVILAPLHAETLFFRCDVQPEHITKTRICSDARQRPRSEYRQRRGRLLSVVLLSANRVQEAMLIIRWI